MSEKTRWLRLWEKIDKDSELADLEKMGFYRGSLKGKTMRASLGTIMRSLRKQMRDLGIAQIRFNMNPNAERLADLKQKIADVRNAAGCVFLKLKEK